MALLATQRNRQLPCTAEARPDTAHRQKGCARPTSSVNPYRALQESGEGGWDAGCACICRLARAGACGRPCGPRARPQQRIPARRPRPSGRTRRFPCTAVTRIWVPSPRVRRAEPADVAEYLQLLLVQAIRWRCRSGRLRSRWPEDRRTGIARQPRAIVGSAGRRGGPRRPPAPALAMPQAAAGAGRHDAVLMTSAVPVPDELAAGHWPAAARPPVTARPAM